MEAEASLACSQFLTVIPRLNQINAVHTTHRISSFYTRFNRLEAKGNVRMEEKIKWFFRKIGNSETTESVLSTRRITARSLYFVVLCTFTFVLNATFFTETPQRKTAFDI
jgi:hypothetical protein